MKKIAFLLAATPFLWSCATAPATELAEAERPDDPSMEVRIERYTPYSEEASIANDIRNECQNERKLSHFIQVYGASNDIAVERVDGIDPTAGGKVLDVAITDAVSQGNPFIGHRKSTEIRGTLYEDGVEQASFTATRTSMGGAFAGFKSSCSVLGRTVEALGQDVAIWLTDPMDDAHLGD